MSLTHFNKKNKNIEMVDISKKTKTKRYAEAKSRLKIDRKLFLILKNDRELQNNLYHTAKIAGVYAAKNTSYQIPLTHNIPIDYVSLTFDLKENEYILLKSIVKSNYSTGLEIEALNSVSCASITIFDMLKSYKKKITIEKIEIVKKRGGKNNIGWYF